MAALPCDQLDGLRNFGQKAKAALAANLLETWKRTALPDVTLVANDGGEFPSNKLLLSVASPFFRDMFNGPFQESSPDRIVLQSVNSRMMRIILDHVDGKDPAFEASLRPVVAEVFRASHMLGVTDLVQFLCILLEKSITLDSYREVWELYDISGSEMLGKGLGACFRLNYQHFLDESIYLDFDPPFMAFIFGHWTAFVNHKALVKIMLRWIQHDIARREDALNPLAKMLHKKKWLPPGYLCHLAIENEVLQKHPDLVLQFQTSDVVNSALFTTHVGHEVLAGSVSVVDFHANRVYRTDFNGRTELKLLPFTLLFTFSSKLRQIAVQYRDKIYLVGEIFTEDRNDFIEYDFDNNSFVTLDASSFHAMTFHRDAFVVGGRMYVLYCESGIGDFRIAGGMTLQWYDFETGGPWTTMALPCDASVCPYGDSFVILQHGRLNDEDVIRATTMTADTIFTIPCKLQSGDTFVNYDGRLWGFSSKDACDKKIGRQYVYELDSKCFKLTETRARCSSEEGGVGRKIFRRIPSLQRHPLIVTNEDYYTWTLSNFEDGIKLGQMSFSDRTSGSLAVPYCKDLTL